MKLIEWSDKFATGIPDIDNEHQELIATINSFYAQQTEHTCKDDLIDILNNIYGSIHAHFMLEERLMLKHGYDEYEEHKSDHANLLDGIRDIAIELEQTSSIDELQLQTKLNDWFLNHFKTHDSSLYKLEQLIANHKEIDGVFVAIFKKMKALIFSKR